MENVKITFVTKRRGTIYVLELIIFLCFYLLVTRFSYSTYNRMVAMLVLSIIIAYHYLSWKKENRINSSIKDSSMILKMMKEKKFKKENCFIVFMLTEEKYIFIECSTTDIDYDFLQSFNLISTFSYYVFPILYGFSFILLYYGMMYWNINLFHYGLIIMLIDGILLAINHNIYKKLEKVTIVYSEKE